MPGDNNNKHRNNIMEEDAEIKKRKAAIASLIEQAKGNDRSYSSYAKDAGISVAAMSRIRGGDYIPKPLTMKKLTSDEAKPRGGITFEILMQAAGYESEDAADARRFGVDEENEKEPYISFQTNKWNDRRALINMCRMYEMECTSQIYTAFADKGFIFKKAERKISYGEAVYCDLDIEIMDQSIKNWKFEFKFIPEGKKLYNPTMIYSALGLALRITVNSETKLTIVINSEELFQKFKKFEHSLAFRGELSMVLYDSSSKRFVDEFYLANYYEGDNSREVYLTR